MGYDTTFSGRLDFTCELSKAETLAMAYILEEDALDHPEWGADPKLRYFNLELTEDKKGIQWDSHEKSYYMVEAVNLLIQVMRNMGVENFGLTGEFLCQGEDIEDRWKLVMVNNVATEVKIMTANKIITCKHCGERFEVDTEVQE
jgi:hypothetical protein